jgi:hypothetical protein
MPWDEDEARQHVARTEELLSGTETLTDTAAREQAMDALHALAQLYGECLARVMRYADPQASAVLASDELIGHLLLVHDLHPHPVEQRVRRALDDVRGAEVLSVREPEVRVALSPQGCGGPSEEELAKAVRDAVVWAAPEIERVETERAVPQPEAATVIPVDALFRGPQPAGNR